MIMKSERRIIILFLFLLQWRLFILGQDSESPGGSPLSPLISAMMPSKEMSQSQRGVMQNGHQSESSAPVFILEPQDTYYIVKNKPLTLTCRAAHTSRIIFKCGGHWVDPGRHINREGVVPETGMKYLETTIEVSKEQVDEHSSGTDGYHCECHAWYHMPSTTQPITSRSKTGVVHSAVLRKRFEREPLSSTVEIGSTKELTCLPPIGQPPPEVFWLKDGEELDVSSDTNLIISNEGNLIINQARLDDHGNYTCGAHNIASRRLSESAFLTVYVNGIWSSWGPWSDCGSKCTRNHQRRSRTCTSPSPLNGGTPCEGEASQRIPCPNNCPEGAIASSDAIDSSSSLTQVTSEEENGQDKTLSSSSQSDTTAMFIGLTLAIILFSLCLVVAVFVVRYRKRTPPSPQTKLVSQVQDIYMPPDVTRSLLAQQQQQQQQIIYQQQKQRLTLPSGAFNNYPTNVSPSYQDGDSCMESPYCHLNFPQGAEGDDDENGDHQQQLYHPHHQDVAPTYFQQSSTNSTPFHSGFNPQSGMATHLAHPHSQSGSSSSSASSSSSQRPRSGQGTTNASQLPSSNNSSGSKKLYNTINSNHPVFQQKTNIATNPHLYPPFSPMKNLQDVSLIPSHHRFPTGAGAVVWGSFGSVGGKISLDESDISLTVLSGSMEHNIAQDMFLAVSRDDKDRPKLSDSQTILSPVVLCGPKSVNLSKPIIVSFQHCACLKQSQWLLSLYASDAPYDKPPKWELLCTVGSMPEEPHPQACVHVDSNRCHVMTDRPIAMLTLVGEPCLSGRACKILRLAAFAPPMTSLLTSPVDWSVRVYIIEDTLDALEGVMQVEQGLGGCLLDKPKSTLFQFGGSNMCLSVQNVAPGWRNKMDVDCQEIPFSHIWSGGRNGLHCSVSLERTEIKASNSLTCDIHVFQKNLPENGQVLEINCDMSGEPLGDSPSRKSLTTKSLLNGINPTLESERIPGTVRRKLCELLDETNSRGNNWRLLAQTLNLERYMDYFSAKDSPTDILLSMWQAKHPEPSAVPDLIASLRLIGRQDAADIMAKSLDPIHL